MAGKIDKYAGIFREADATGTNTGDETNATIKTKLGSDLSDKYDSSNFIAGTDYLATGGQVKTVLEALTTTNRLSGTAIKELTAKNFTSAGSTYIGANYSGTQTLTGGVTTKILFNLKFQDNLNEFNSTTWKFYPSYTGYSWICPSYVLNTSTTSYLKIYKDGSDYLTYPLFGTALLTPINFYFEASHYYEFYINSTVNNTIGAYGTMTLVGRTG